MLKRRFMANRYARINLLIGLCLLFAWFCCFLWGVFGFNRFNKDVKDITGYIEKWKHYEETWTDCIDPYSPGPYFTILLDNGEWFQTIGTSYKNIDDTLYSNLVTRSKITVTFNSHNHILGIQYNGKTYIDSNHVLSQIENEEKIEKIVLICVVISAFVIAIVCFYINDKRYKSFCENNPSTMV